MGVQIHRIAGLLVAAVNCGALPATAEQQEEAAALHLEWMELAVLLESDLLVTVGILEKAGVPHRILKGPSFAHLDYPDPSLRVFGDIDILVPSESYDVAAGTLSSHDYVRRYREVRRGFDRRFGKGASFTAPNGRDTDLHRTFSMGPFGLTIDLDEVWSRSSTLVLAGRPFLALDADHRFLHACYHAAIGNKTPHLVPLRDLAGMLERSDDPVSVERVRSSAASWRAEAVVARAVRLAWDRFALEETELSCWAAGYRPTARDLRSLSTYLDPDMGYAARSFAAVQVVPGLGQKARFALAMAFPDRTFGAGRHRGRWQRWRAAARQILRMRRSGIRR